MAQRVDGMSRREERKKKENEEKYMSVCRLYDLKIRAQIQNQAVTTALHY